jgi:uncharacterized protein with ParB-like and HNH nuclease domain
LKTSGTTSSFNADADYFIGSMVVFKPASSDTAGVVDGQQRLTTITMILAALRNAFKMGLCARIRRTAELTGILRDGCSG